MTIWHLRELIKDLPSNSPVVMWIQRQEGPGLMAQVSNSTCINNETEGRPYLLLMAGENDIIRDGKLKPTPAPQLSASLSPRLPSPAPAQIEGPAVAEVRESTALAVIDSNGKPGGVLKR